MKKFLLVLFFFGWWTMNILNAQKYFTREGEVKFFSEAPLENIEAVNRSATSVLDAATGRLEFAVLIKAFQFEKAKMQEDFNENFMDSSKFPKATFTGRITNWEDVDLSKEETVEVDVEGTLTIHGVSRPLSTTASLTPGGKNLTAQAAFTVTVADFDIKVPGLVRDKIAKEVEVSLQIDYQPLNN